MTAADAPLTRAVRIRRWALIAAPAVAGALTVVGVIADPAPYAQGRELIEAYAASPDPLQVKVLAYHFAYTLLAAAAIGLALQVRRRGSGMANVAVLLGFLGISSIPGFLIGDFVDSAMGRLVGADAAVQVGETVGQQWAFIVMQLSGFAGLLLALPLAAAAAWRAGLLPWWATAAVVAGEVAFLGFAVTLPGNVLFTGGLAVLSVSIARVGWGTWAALEVPAEPARITSLPGRGN